MKNLIMLAVFVFVMVMQSITSAATFNNLGSSDSPQLMYLDDFDDDNDNDCDDDDDYDDNDDDNNDDDDDDEY